MYVSSEQPTNYYPCNNKLFVLTSNSCFCNEIITLSGDPNVLVILVILAFQMI